jgi:hypothetical protein
MTPATGLDKCGPIALNSRRRSGLMGITAPLQLKLYANGVEIGVWDDPFLCQTVLPKLLEWRPGVLPSSPAVEKGLDSELPQSDDPKGADGILSRFAAELDLPFDQVKAACDPDSHPPFLRLDEHCWAALKRHTGKRGPGSIPPIVLAATLLNLWFRHARRGNPPTVAEAQDVLATIHDRDHKPNRAVQNCPWLRVRRGRIALNPAEIHSALALVKAYFTKASPPEDLYGSRVRERRAGRQAGQASGVAKSAPVSADTQREPSPVATRRPARIGAKSVARDLVAQGFFVAPRTMREVIHHVRVSLAKGFSTNDMSKALNRLTEDGKLTRRESTRSRPDNTGMVYEYLAAS